MLAGSEAPGPPGERLRSPGAVPAAGDRGVLRAQVYPGGQDFPQPLLLPLSQPLLRLRGAALRHLE